MRLIILVVCVLFGSFATASAAVTGAPGLDGEGDQTVTTVTSIKVRPLESPFPQQIQDALDAAEVLDPEAGARLRADLERGAIGLGRFSGDDRRLGVHDWNTIAVEDRWWRNEWALAVILLHEYEHVENSPRPENTSAVSGDARMQTPCAKCHHARRHIRDYALAFKGCDHTDTERCAKAARAVKKLKQLIGGDASLGYGSSLADCHAILPGGGGAPGCGDDFSDLPADPSGIPDWSSTCGCS